MEMAQQAAQTASFTAATVQAHAPRALRTGWREEETQLLWNRVREASQQGAPLREVFESVAAALGRKPNSIRNYYYAQLKERDEPGLKRALPFETFSDDEVRSLVRTILRKKGEGMSVRACVTEMAAGDKARMLRYQNKYRSTLRARPELIREVMEELRSEGVACGDPYTARMSGAEPEELMEQAAQRVRSMGEPALFKMIEGMNTLIDMAMKNEEKPAAAIGLGSEAFERAMLERDRLSARVDLLRIALDDEQKKSEAFSAAGTTLVHVIRSFLAMSELKRAQELGRFCGELEMHLPELEQAVGMIH